jgi:hypothetical protein
MYHSAIVFFHKNNVLLVHESNYLSDYIYCHCDDKEGSESCKNSRLKHYWLQTYHNTMTFSAFHNNLSLQEFDTTLKFINLIKEHKQIHPDCKLRNKAYQWSYDNILIDDNSKYKFTVLQKGNRMDTIEIGFSNTYTSRGVVKGGYEKTDDNECGTAYRELSEELFIDKYENNLSIKTALNKCQPEEISDKWKKTFVYYVAVEDLKSIQDNFYKYYKQQSEITDVSILELDYCLQETGKSINLNSISVKILQNLKMKLI